jgi:nicotinamidase-related amidase
MLRAKDTLLLVVDFQGKLARIVQDSAAVLDAASKLVRGARVLEVPIVWTEQNPQGLGPTVPELAELLPGGGQALPKFHFSCWRDQGIRHAVEDTRRKQVLLAGIESHVCVYQTASDLLSAGYDVHLAVDAVSSRSEGNRQIGLAKAQGEGAVLTSVESALFELLEVAQGDKFKEILKIVR